MKYSHLGLLVSMASVSCSKYDPPGTDYSNYQVIKKIIPSGLNLCEERQAIDLCEDVKFTLGYNPGTLPGIDDILFENTTEDTCGYVSTKHGGIIGMQQKWTVKGIQGDASAVATLWEKIGNDKVFNEVYLLAPNGSPGNIVVGMPNTADRIKVTLDETYDGSSGVDYLFGNGICTATVTAYGETRSTSTGREHVIPIVNPTLIPFTVPTVTTSETIVEEHCEMLEDVDPLCGDPMMPDANPGPLLP